jgi:hypothetical protein
MIELSRAHHRIGLLPIFAAFMTIGLLALLPQRIDAQNEYFFPAGVTFDQSIPSPEEFLGYPIGTFATRHDRIVSYLQELARLSDRATYQSIGKTYELRPMPVLTVTSPANHARLETIRQEHLASLEPGTPPGGDIPAIAHLGYNIHGNENSAGESALLTAYWLVAGTGADHERYLNEGVFHVEPTLNPDGRGRWVHWTNMNRAEPFVADPLDREHNEAWPAGRTNHYWFDLNRDWYLLVNPESRARVDFHHKWRANVVTDHHEMGTNSSYFFEPPEPVVGWNPLLPERLFTEITLIFTELWADALDEIGSFYYTKEVFDKFYPGYGSSYPAFLGGMSVLFEQASSRGFVQKSTHHGEVTLAFTIRNQLRTGMATVRGTIENRETLQQYQREFYTSAISEAAEYEIDGWVFGDAYDPTLNREFIDYLLRHRIEVYDLNSTQQGDGVTFEPGHAWVVPASQPMYRLARSIFERAGTFADSVFYDVSAWTVSLAYGMPDYAVTNGRLAMGDRVTEVPALEGAGPVARSSISYLMDWSNSGAPRALHAMQAAGVRAEAAFKPFTARTTNGDVSFPRGSISIPVSNQNLDPDSLHAAVTTAAREANVPIHSAVTGRTVDGIDLGSGNFRPVRAPRVLMLMGEGVSSYEVGQLWHLMDQRIAMPVTKVDVTDLGRVTWSDYDVLVLVSGDLSVFSGDRLDVLKSWIRGGGTLVAQRGAAVWATRNGLTPNVAEPGTGEPATEDDEAEEDTAPRRDYADAGDIEGAKGIGGSIWEADLDLTHPLGFGYRRRFLPVWRDHNFFFAPSSSEYSTVARLVEDDPWMAGYISDENREWLQGSPSVIADRLGRGTVVLLVDNTNFRGYWRGTNKLFLNALFFGDQIQVP